MSAKGAAEALACKEDEKEFFERLFIIDRMGREEDFTKDVVEHYNKIRNMSYVYA